MTEPHSYHHGDLRNALLQSARRQLEEHGFENVSVAKAAAEAGVSVAAPYRHFADRAALLGELAAIGFGELAEALGAVPAHGGPRERMIQSGVAYLQYADEHPQMFRLMFTHNRRASVGEAGQQSLTALRSLGDAIAGGGRLAVPQATAVRVLWGLVHGLAMLRIGHLPALAQVAVVDHRADIEAALDGVGLPERPAP